MTFTQLLTLQILAHLLADYLFQTDKWVESKNNTGIKGRHFLMHLGIVFITSWLLSFQWLFVIGAGIITLLHTLLDILKSKLHKVDPVRRYLFFTDQILHLIIIVAVVWWYNNTFSPNIWIVNWPFSERTLVVATAFLFCTKPANIIIREIFKFYAISVPKTSDTPQELPNAGQLIGNIERLLTLTFMLIGQFEAVGLLIAAKSILRFGEKDNLKSEYVVIGTLLSFGIAIFTGVFLSYY
jgi:hypothetical protein